MDWKFQLLFVFNFETLQKFSFGQNLKHQGSRQLRLNNSALKWKFSGEGVFHVGMLFGETTFSKYTPLEMSLIQLLEIYLKFIANIFFGKSLKIERDKHNVKITNKEIQKLCKKGDFERLLWSLWLSTFKGWRFTCDGSEMLRSPWSGNYRQRVLEKACVGESTRADKCVYSSEI